MPIEEYPMVISKIMTDNLFTDTAKALAEEAGLLEKHRITDEENPAEWGSYTQYYYTFTDAGLKLFTGKPARVTSIKQRQWVNKYILARIGDINEHVLESMKLFRFDISSDESLMNELIESHLDDAEKLYRQIHGKKPYKNSNDWDEFIQELLGNLMDQFFKIKKYSYNQGELYHLFSTTDVKTWAGRIYTPFTSIQSEARRFLTCTEYPDDNLVNLDFATFQVHCLIYAVEQLLPNNNTGNLKQDLQRSGFDFYNELGQERYRKPKNPLPDKQRKILKKRTVSALFGKQNDRKHGKAYAAMKKLYPEFVERLNELKTGKAYAEFSKRFNPNAQCIRYKQSSFYGTYYEVQLMRKIWDRLWASGIPFLTIHDAVLVPESRRLEAIDIMHEEAVKFFGYCPEIDDDLIERLA